MVERGWFDGAGSASGSAVIGLARPTQGFPICTSISENRAGRRSGSSGEPDKYLTMPHVCPASTGLLDDDVLWSKPFGIWASKARHNSVPPLMLLLRKKNRKKGSIDQKLNPVPVQ